MVAERTVTPQQRRATVAEFASRLFGNHFTAQDVIERRCCLYRGVNIPPPKICVRRFLTPHPAGILQTITIQAFKSHPLSR
jgi:hypothetical protein